ncbi:MAG: butyrate kinase [Clostridiales bacterium]|nr:butyrate kinase [Clostridiales bacterium]
MNPGSTSTKLAVYENERLVVKDVIRHDTLEFDKCSALMDQKPQRVECLMKFLQDNDIALAGLSAVVGRGGLLKPLCSGTYIVGEEMLKDLYSSAYGVHAASLGAIIADEIGRQQNIPAYIVDSVAVDEFEPPARLSGLPGMERRSFFHALNAKAVARLCARELGMRYEDARFVVAHLGGGITVGAHRYGRVIDVNDALAGDGPFTPERSGAVPLHHIIELCFAGQHTKQEIKDMVSKRGGMKAYLGIHDLSQAENMIQNGDERAALVVEAMAYQIAKEIGAMVTVLEGRLHAIILTGGLAHSTRFTGAIKQRVDQLAPVMTYPGENELEALAQGALRVLRGEEKAKHY